MSAGHTIRRFETIDEYRACVDLQEATWGGGFSERVSPAILKVSQILGGVSAGAWDEDGRLVGFVFGMTGLRDGELVHWSDMLAVRPDVRDRGLGRELKAYQRERVMELGVGKMFWTFDPLQSRNAYLNFDKLGIVAREYERDMYGQTDSPLHRGIGTDRFIALWLLDTDRVRDRLAGARPEPIELGGLPRALAADTGNGHPRPREPDLTVGNERIVVEIPSDVGRLMDDDMDLARAWREATRAVFTTYIGSGYEAREFVRGGRISSYVLMHPDA